MYIYKCPFFHSTSFFSPSPHPRATFDKSHGPPGGFLIGQHFLHQVISRRGAAQPGQVRATLLALQVGLQRNGPRWYQWVIYGLSMDNLWLIYG